MTAGNTSASLSVQGRVAVLGLGIMGRAFAENLVKAGFSVSAYNRSEGPRRQAAQAGVQTFDTPQQAVAGAKLVIMMLSTAEVTLQMTRKILPELGPGAVLVQMGTIGVEGTAELIDAVAEYPQVALIDAPVSGTKGPAQRGEVTILASGPDKHLTEHEDLQAAAQQVFDVIGKRTIWLGQVGAGSNMKLVLNAWLVAVMNGIAETAVLAEGFGISPDQLVSALQGGPLATPYAISKLSKLAQGDNETEMALKWGSKDAALALAAQAEAEGPRLPGLETIAAQFSAAAESGLAELDVCAIHQHLRA